MSRLLAEAVDRVELARALDQCNVPRLLGRGPLSRHLDHRVANRESHRQVDFR